MTLEKHRLGRRARGDVEFGSDRIVIGTLAAIRHLKTSHLSRKDIADFAGVTPPLVTYYFPDRGSLIEAATLPVVKALADEMNRCVSQSAPPERVLWDMIELIVGTRSRDGSVIDAYARFRDENPNQKVNPLVAVDDTVRAFFERWLEGERKGAYYALLSQAALMAMCESRAHRRDSNERYQCQLIYQVVVCIVAEAEKFIPRAEAPELIDHDSLGVDRWLALAKWSPSSPVASVETRSHPAPMPSPR